ncbi:hypothetical protein GALMADRAFT_1345890 [Galerina marginata CBS 339.88]|uniref:Uncharacterized protein n=1 Tax=Galerina marginata (strain CBS 339.88) TaxID=685588 RepID=A0A067SKC1_GALM3|nr:hypothetical protein GALMADRAFT_1345890 [Galerina marginata CBS 339.88]
MSSNPIFDGMNLPDPVLVEIFRCCLTSPAIVPSRPTDERERLMFVCHQWRNLIVSTPGLWSSVIFLPVASQTAGRLQNLAGTWLQRSQGVYVSVIFETDLRRQGPQPTPQYVVYGAGAFCIVNTIILRCVSRIIALKCILATSATIRSFLTIPPGRFFSLQYIDLTLTDHLNQLRSRFHTWEFSMFTVFHQLPRLRDARFCTLNAMALNPDDFLLPWNQLTHLYLGTTFITPEVFLRIIHTSSLLLVDGLFRIKFTKPAGCTKFHAHVRGCRVPSAFPTAIAHRLKVLQLILHYPRQDIRMFQALRLPALFSLQIRVQDPKKGWELRLFRQLVGTIFRLRYFSLIPFVSPSAPQNSKSENKTKIPHRLIASSEMESLLTAIPTVSTLVMGQGLHLNSPTLKKIAQGVLLPFLEHLRLWSVSGGQVLEMVKERNNLVQYKALRPQNSGNYLVLYLSSISVLHMLVPREEERIVNEEMTVLRQYTASSANVNFVIEGRNSQAFYYMT